MPIYAYRCSTCGYAKDLLQKMSDPVLTVCPECHAPTFQKQVTAAGFQLKGSGWYATDFRGGDKPGPKTTEAEGGKGAESGGAAAPAAAEGGGAAAPAPAPADGAKSDTNAAAKSGGAKAGSAPGPAAAPAAPPSSARPPSGTS